MTLKEIGTVGEKLHDQELKPLQYLDYHENILIVLP